MEKLQFRPEIIDSLIDLKLRAGFHTILGKSSKDYSDQFKELAKPFLENPVEGAHLTLVEERIPLETQIKALGISINESVFRYQESEHDKPHVEWLRVIPRVRSLPTKSQLEGLPNGLRAATPFEGINCEIPSLMRESVSLAMAGGDESRQSALVLERFLGKPRVSFTYLSDSDQHIDILAAIRGN